jgi:hypothetical protein
MLIAAERLLIKLRQPASRAAELIELRRRLRAELASGASEDEHALAREVHAAKLAVVAELRDIRSCASCSTGQPWPNGHYSGGDCCCGVTNEVFDDHEVGALAHAGTRARDLVPPRDEHAGCSFRGARGCSLEVEHRPARCVHYVCDVLRHELHDRGRLDTIEAKLGELNQAMQRFTAARKVRLDEQVVGPLIEAIAAARRR